MNNIVSHKSSYYGAQNEAYMCWLAENIVITLCISKL